MDQLNDLVTELRLNQQKKAMWFFISLSITIRDVWYDEI